MQITQSSNFVVLKESGRDLSLGMFDASSIEDCLRNHIEDCEKRIADLESRRDFIKKALEIQSKSEVLPGATKEEIRSYMMQDLVGDYDDPSQVSEWKWVEEKACFEHKSNGQHGVWEFVVNLSYLDYSDAPPALAKVIQKANEDGIAYLIFHQGT